MSGQLNKLISDVSVLRRMLFAVSHVPSTRLYGGREGPSIATSIWRFCNGTLQWKYDAMEMRNGSAQLNNYYSTILITLSHFAPGPSGFRYIDTCIGRLASARVFNLAR